MSTDSHNKDKQKKTEELDDTLAWLEELALDEPVAKPKSAAQPSTDASLEDQLSWLDQLSAEEEPLEEQPTLSWEHTKPTGDLLSPSLPLGSAEESGTQEWDDAISWLEELSESQDETSPEELEELLGEQEEMPAPPRPTPPQAEAKIETKKEEKPSEKKSKGGGLFGGEEDFSVSAEEIAAAAAYGAEVEGFDFPADDDEAAMAWLEGLLGGDELDAESVLEAEKEEALVIDEESLYDDLLALADEAEEGDAEAMLLDITPAEDEILLEDLLILGDEQGSTDALAETKAEPAVAPPPVEKAPEPPLKKRSGGLFGGEEDFSVSAEEIAAAAAYGAEVEGFDFPADDDEATMAWLEGLIGGDDFTSTSTPKQEEAAKPTAEDEALESLFALAQEPEEELFNEAITLEAQQPAESTQKKVDNLFTFPDEDDILDESIMTEGQDTGEYLLDVLGDVQLNIGEEPESPIEDMPTVPPTKKRSGGLFGGEEDFTVSAEEIAAAAAHGAEVEGFDFPADDDEAAMAWLEGLIGGDDLRVESSTPAASDDALLGDLMAMAQEDEEEQGQPPSEEDALLGELLALAEEQERAEDQFDGMMDEAVTEAAFDQDEDEDNPLAWLDDITGEFESSITDDLVDFPEADEEDEEDDVAVPNFDLSAGIPTDPEEAMKLLEQLAAEQNEGLDEVLGVPLTAADALAADDNLWQDEVDLPESVAEDLPFSEDGFQDTTRMSEQEAQALEADDFAESDLFGDLDLGVSGDSLSWLEGGDALADLPEDPDAAIDFLEQLSADEEIDLHDDEAIEDLLEAELTMDDVFSLEERDQDRATANAEIGDDFFPEAVSSSMPDWLAMGIGNSGDTFNALDWLEDSGSDGGILGWLESEEEVSQKGPERPSRTQSFDTFDLMGSSTPATTTPTQPQPQRKRPEPEQEKPKERPTYDPSIFRPARGMLLAGDIEGALEEYEVFFGNSQNVAILVDELEQVVSGVNQHPLVQRLLGDAYMRNGQLKEALDTYILVRDKL